MSENIKVRMQAIGKSVAKELPKGYGFFMMCFPFNEPNAQGEYVSNGQRADVIAVMQNFIKRNPMQQIGRN